MRNIPKNRAVECFIQPLAILLPAPYLSDRFYKKTKGGEYGANFIIGGSTVSFKIIF